MTTLYLCIDCTLAIAGYDAHEIGRVTPLAVTEFLTRVGANTVSRSDDEDAHADFSWAPCDGCGTTLGGERVAHEMSDDTAPACATCGDANHLTSEHAAPLDSIPTDLDESETAIRRDAAGLAPRDSTNYGR